jgi:hypothetical protein
MEITWAAQSIMFPTGMVRPRAQVEHPLVRVLAHKTAVGTSNQDMYMIINIWTNPAENYTSVKGTTEDDTPWRLPTDQLTSDCNEYALLGGEVQQGGQVVDVGQGGAQVVLVDGAQGAGVVRQQRVVQGAVLPYVQHCQLALVRGQDGGLSAGSGAAEKEEAAWLPQLWLLLCSPTAVIQ